MEAGFRLQNYGSFQMLISNRGNPTERMVVNCRTGCQVTWLDSSKAERMKDKRMSEFQDSDDFSRGKASNAITDTDRSILAKRTVYAKDADLLHIGYEAFRGNGVYFDAEEFTD